MGVFNKSICDCCACPMQSVLEQLVEPQTQINVIVTTLGSISILLGTFTLTKIKDFIATTSVEIDIAICKIITVGFQTLPTNFKLKPVRKDIGGECACCEDPMTNLLVGKIGTNISIPSGGGPNGIISAGVKDVGEGIVLLENIDMGDGIPITPFAITSTCLLDAIGPPMTSTS
ncbi:hypothetical protein [Chengkuizengella axinellae]|uniref:Uncharacterized protein n=1 Tax=Chengkuizengella axinellae TaxID=3064388 RepID=A0ABT9J4B2_9BACL|nr:hypothetical protein [Chengkuizengella sp. 2205SS18-9]MDP5276313.1 hypothetical protein [Chengkuizengella sp. 2205SS18-9]